MWKYLPFTFKNLLRNRRRTILTILSVTVSVSLLGVLLAVYAGFFHREVSEVRALRLLTGHKFSITNVMPWYYGDRIRRVDDLQEVSVLNWFGGTYIDNRSEHMFPRVAVEPEKIFNIFTEFHVPPEQLAAFQRDRQAIAIGKTLAERAGLKLGQRITIKGDIYPVDLELVVRAIFEGQDDFSSFFHWKYLEEGIPKSWRNGAALFIIRAKSAEDVPRIAKAVDEQFRNSSHPTRTAAEGAYVLEFVEQLGNIKLFLVSIAGAVVFTILLVSANTMAMSVRERILEVGVMRTLGFTSTSVVAMIIAEAVAMALLGGLVGVALSYFATQALESVAVGVVTGFVLPLWGVPICLAVAILIGLVSSVIPAWMAARTTIADALRHMG